MKFLDLPRKSGKFWLGLTLFLTLGAWGVFECLRVRPPLRGELEFAAKRPVLKVSVPVTGTVAKRGYLRTGIEWVSDKLSLEKKVSRKASFGDHFQELRFSGAGEQEEIGEIEQWTENLEKRFLARYPEFTISYKAVPAEENGFLRWLELSESKGVDPWKDLRNISQSKRFDLPPELEKFVDEGGPWPAAEMAAWRLGHEPILAELREIGLCSNQSAAGVELGRYFFLSGGFAMECLDVLKLDARDQIERGQVEEAMKAIAAGRGMAEHFLRIETPTFMMATIGNLMRLDIQNFAFEEIMPLVPKEQFAVEDWEKALLPRVPTPRDFAKILQGEWHMMRNYWVLPMVCNAEDPKYPRDPAALLDFLALNFLHYQTAFSGKTVADWKGAAFPLPLDSEHLSTTSQEFVEELVFRDWYRGYERLVEQYGLEQAVFTVMKRGGVPVDGVHGQRYEWDPVTRELGPPSTPEFDEMRLDPIVLPHLPL